MIKYFIVLFLILSSAQVGAMEDADKIVRDIYFAVAAGDTQTARSLLSTHNIDLNQPLYAKDNDEMPLLHWASFQGNFEIVEYLLAHKADPNALDAFQTTPLYRAIVRGHGMIVRALLQAGAQPNVKGMDGNSLLYMAVVRACAIDDESSDYQNIIHDLLTHGAQCQAPPGAVQDAIPLMYALKHNKRDIAELLWQYGDHKDCSSDIIKNLIRFDLGSFEMLLDIGFPVDFVIDDVFTPLFAALSHKGLRLLKILLEHNVDINKGRGQAFFHPLFVVLDALLRDIHNESVIDDPYIFEDMVRCLLIKESDYNLNMRGEVCQGADESFARRLFSYFTILEEPSRSMMAQIARTLIMYGASMGSLSNEQLDYILGQGFERAAATGNHEKLSFALESLAHTGKRGREAEQSLDEPLRYAVGQGRAHIIPLLLEHGANPFAIRRPMLLDDKEETAFSINQHRITYTAQLNTISPEMYKIHMAIKRILGQHGNKMLTQQPPKKREKLTTMYFSHSDSCHGWARHDGTILVKSTLNFEQKRVKQKIEEDAMERRLRQEFYPLSDEARAIITEYALLKNGLSDTCPDYLLLVKAIEKGEQSSVQNLISLKSIKLLRHANTNLSALEYLARVNCERAHPHEKVQREDILRIIREAENSDSRPL